MKDVVGDAMPKTVELTALLVQAYVKGNTIAVADIPELIHTVNSALKRAGASKTNDTPKPAVPVAESVQSQYLVCLEDGEHVTLLRRHLKNKFGMSPEDYRKKWKLPYDYPMVPAHYSKQRAQNAIRHGLGKG